LTTITSFFGRTVTRRHPLRALVAAVFAVLMLTALPSVAAAAVPDPLARGPYTAVEIEQAKLGLMALNEPPQTGSTAAAVTTTQIRGQMFYPGDRASGSPVIVLLHGNHSSCFGGGSPLTTPPCVFERNDKGYAYMGENLATWGYTVFSIDGDTLGAVQDNTAKGMHLRRQAIAAALDGLYAANQGAVPDDADHNLGATQVGKLDFTRIGLMGHSRGGDAVTSFIDYNRTRPAPGRRYTGLRGVISLAPVDYERRAPYGVAYMTLVGYCDGDVSNLQGSRFFERSQYIKPDDPYPRIQAMLHGANHNWFNSTWFVDGDDSTSSDPACSTNNTTNPNNIRLSGGTYTRPGSSANPGPDTFGSGNPALMGDQEKAGLAVMGSFFRRYVGSEVDFDSIETGELSSDGVTPQLPVSACPSLTPAGTRISCFDRMQQTHFAPPAERLDVIRPEPDNPLGLSAVGTALTGSGFSNPYTNPGGINPIPPTTPGGYDWCNPEPTQFQTSTVGETGLPTAVKGCPLPPAAALGGQNGVRESAPVNHSYGLQLALAWDNPIAATGAPASLKTTIPAASQDVSGFKALAMSAAVNFFDTRNAPRGTVGLWNPGATTQDFTIAVTDKAGHTGTVSAASPRYGTALHQTVGNITSRVHITLNGLRIPLTDFSSQGVDLTKVAKVELLFGGAGKPQTGSIELSDVRFQESVAGPTVFTDQLAAAKAATFVTDSPRDPALPVPDVQPIAAKSATPACAPVASIVSRIAGLKKLTLTGTAKGCATKKVKAVQVTFYKQLGGGKCRFLQSNGKLGTRVIACSSDVGLLAKGTTRWSLKLKAKLTKGRYGVFVRAVDAAGVRQSAGKHTTLKIG
jgi:dienelactone hydrolase